jgi:NTP pyrophosphatase (non-canonical NTP hydrolase)
MTFHEYQIEAATTAVYQEKMYPITSLMVEAAELADLFIKPYLRGDDRKPFREDIISEAGDVLWNLAAILSDHNISLAMVAEMNIRKLRDRQERGVLQGSGDHR